MFILRSPHRAYGTRYLLICNDDFSEKIGGKIDVHTLKGSPEGSSDQEFRGSILCDVIEIS